MNAAENTKSKRIGVKVRVGELPLLNRQLARFNYNTLGDLVSKITQVTEDQQIDIMKTNLQTSGLVFQANHTIFTNILTLPIS